MAGDTDTVGSALALEPDAVPVVRLPDEFLGHVGVSIARLGTRPRVILHLGAAPVLDPHLVLNPDGARRLAARLIAMADEIDRVTGVRRG